MSTNRLLMAGLMLGLVGVAPGCQSGGESSGGSVGDGAGDDFNGLLGGPGLGDPGHSSTSPTTASDGIGFSPGFGAPPYSANTTGTAGSGIAFTPGFGGPPSSSGGQSVPPPSGPSTGGRGLLSDLSDAEAQQLCDSLEQQYSQSISASEAMRLSCSLEALGQSFTIDANGQQVVDPEACENAVAVCLASRGDGTGEIQCNADEFRACEASVSEFQACFSATIAQFSQLLDALDCQNLTSPTAIANALSGLSAGAPQCAQLQSSCPGLLGGGAGTGGTGGISGRGGIGGIGGTGGTGGAEPPTELCDDTCDWPGDGECDDGGPDSDYNACELGTDCTDCGPRPR